MHGSNAVYDVFGKSVLRGDEKKASAEVGGGMNEEVDEGAEVVVVVGNSAQRGSVIEHNHF
jgi:hypothetical protein